MRRSATSSLSVSDVPNARAIVGITSSGSRSACSGTHTTPSEKSSTASGELQGEPRLSRAAGAGQSYQSLRAQEPTGLIELPLASDQQRRLNRQVRRIEAVKRRELFVAELVKPERLAEVFQPVTSEVANRYGRIEQLTRRLREENLASVPGVADPRGLMHVDPGVLSAHDERLARVQTHSHAERALRELRLGLHRRRDGLSNAREGNEEAIALRADLHAALRGKRSSQEPAVLGQNGRVPFRTKLLQQRCRLLDIGEEQGNRAGGKVTHGPAMIPRPDVNRKVAARSLLAYPGPRRPEA
jgi:hypothetical protein